MFNSLFNNKKSLILSEGWESYITSVDGHQTAIRVDIGALHLHDEKFNRLIHTWTLSIPYSHDDDNGWPLPDEVQRLNAFEDWLHEHAKTLPMWMVGVVTQQGTRDFVFLSSKVLNWKKMINQLLSGGPTVSYTCDEYKHDRGNYYHQFLYPSQYSWNWIHSGRGCRHLQEQGDALTVSRKIRYSADFYDEAAVQAFAQEAVALPYGMMVENIRIYNERGCIFFVVELSNIDIPQHWHLVEITNELIDLAEKQGGSFSGWRAEVVLS